MSEDSRDEAEALSRFVCESITEYAIFTISPEGDIATWNPGAERAFGFTRDEVVGTSFAIIFTAEDRSAGFPASEMRNALEHGRLDRDCWHVRKDGTRFWGTNTVQPLVDGNGRSRGFTKIVRDSTERYEAAVALRESEERFRLLVESVEHYAMFSIAPQGAITLWNPGAQKIFGYRQAEILGESFAQLFTGEDVARGVPEAELRRACELGQVENERWQQRGDGTRFIARRRITSLKGDSLGSAGGFSITAHDVTEARATEKTMWRRAFHDGLTGLPNRALFVEHLQRRMAHTKRHPDARFAVFFLDLDRFKTINDRMGHVLADRLLKQVAQRLRTCVRPEDVVARLGGDEFTVLVSSITGRAEVLGMAERIHLALEAPIAVEGHEVRATASIGIALGTADYERPEEIVLDADVAMYEAKARGRANTIVFEGAMRGSALSRHALESELRRAVERGELFLEYLPVVELHELRVVGFEALVCWQHPTRGTLQLADFIEAAERTGLTVPIDEWALRTACAQLRAWQVDTRGMVPLLTMSVRMSGAQLANGGFCRMLQRVLGDAKVAARSLKLAFAESALMDKSDMVTVLLADLRMLHVDVYIDDFGPGCSSLSYLRMLQANAVKIDRSVLAGAAGNPERTEAMRSIVTLAHELRLAVIVAGVESAEELTIVRELACEFAHGALFSAPLCAAAASALVAKRRASWTPSPVPALPSRPAAGGG